MKRRAVIVGALVGSSLAGAAIGVGAYTFIYARGYSYLTNDPAACANCHVMHEQYDAWLNSAHHGVATCNDCHTPEPLLSKYGVKALNGFNHALAFTTGNFEEPIRATDLNRRVAQKSCLKCHDTLVHSLEWPGNATEDSGSPFPACARCHGAVGHPF